MGCLYSKPALSQMSSYSAPDWYVIDRNGFKTTNTGERTYVGTKHRSYTPNWYVIDRNGFMTTDTGERTYVGSKAPVWYDADRSPR